MTNAIKYTLLLLSLVTVSSAYSQTLKAKDIVITTLIPDNFMGRYNAGFEYFFSANKKANNNLLSVGINGGKTSARMYNQKIDGFDLSAEINIYGEALLTKKWNEFGGIKVAAGNFKNEVLNENNNFYYMGITTGIQPIIVKKIALKLSADLGYMKNGLSNTLLFNSNSTSLYTGFAMLFNVGLGVKF